MRNRAVCRILTCLLLLAATGAAAVDFTEWSADFTHPYFTLWRQGYKSKLYGAHMDTGQVGWRVYDVLGEITLGTVKCLEVRYTTNTGTDYSFYIAQDTGGNIRLLKEGTLSFESNPPIWFSANTSVDSWWAINYTSGERRFSIAYTGTYSKNAYGFGPYENCRYIRHYWSSALAGLIVATPRLGYVDYDGRTLSELTLPAIWNIEGTVTDQWTGAPVADATVKMEGGAPRQTKTNAQGFYRFTDLPNDYLTLVVEKKDFRTYSQIMTPESNGTKLADVELIPETGTIRGTVTDAASGLPIQNIIIQRDGIETTRVYTDASGKYAMDEVRVGSHYIQAWGNQHLLQGKQAAVIVDATVVINFVMEGVNGTISGILRDRESNAIISGGYIQLDSIESTRVSSGTDGAFLLENISPGVHALQAWADGYLFSQTNITLEAGAQLNIGNLLLLSSAGLLPEGQDFNFEQGTEGWVVHGVTAGGFDVPASSSNGGSLGLSPGGSQTCFGYWESPPIAFTPGRTYRARFILRGSLENPEHLPMARLRVNSGNSQSAGMLTVDSLGKG
ncbi:MAG TPA: carboxypeptidase-like regulatory domain-containing protein, partial [Candidatus Sumerlaeota bacterium]|nr:carboxypeptidase-like regulatory domain-containing protein [Candidatus Sumerlaeota bacterium]